MNPLSAATHPRIFKVLFLGYSIGFLVGTYTHAAGLAQHGWLAYPVPLAIGIYWDALTLLDPLTVGLLWWQPKAGLRLALAIMASDISLNTYVYLAGYLGPPVPNMVPLTLFDQTLFGLFLFVTAPLAYQLLQKKPG